MPAVNDNIRAMHRPTRLGTPTGCTPSALYLPPYCSILSLAWPKDTGRRMESGEYCLYGSPLTYSKATPIRAAQDSSLLLAPSGGSPLLQFGELFCHAILRIAALLIGQPRAGACGTSSLTLRQRSTKILEALLLSLIHI